MECPIQRQRTVYRLTLVKAWTLEELTAYSEPMASGQPDFREVKRAGCTVVEPFFETRYGAGFYSSAVVGVDIDPAALRSPLFDHSTAAPMATYGAGPLDGAELSRNSRLTFSRFSTPLCLLTNPRLSDLPPDVGSLSVCLLLCPRLLTHLPDFLLRTLRLPDLPPDVGSLSVCLLLCPRLLTHLPDFLLRTLRLPDLPPDVGSLSVCLLLCPRLLTHPPDFLLRTLRLPDLPPDVGSLSVRLLSSSRLPLCSIFCPPVVEPSPADPPTVPCPPLHLYCLLSACPILYQK
ncbi:unnamed protein product [Boreogadus saida]